MMSVGDLYAGPLDSGCGLRPETATGFARQNPLALPDWQRRVF
jgi:hypothetical protein